MLELLMKKLKYPFKEIHQDYLNNFIGVITLKCSEILIFTSLFLKVIIPFNFLINETAYTDAEM